MKANRKVLLIYTGGTIGMMKDAQTGVLAPVDFKELRMRIPEVNQIEAELHAIAFEQPIDSSNMGLEHWQMMVKIIEANYANYDGFVILHGSDTMAYTASALSFMLINLAKPVILTGSQLPIGMVRTDGKENVITAIEIASTYINGVAMVPEVAIYFEYQLYRGNRTFKYNAEHFEAFRSPNYPELAEAGIKIKYNRNAIREAPTGAFHTDAIMDNRIAVLTLFPGISKHIIEAALNIAENKALVVRTFGSGNAMTHPWFYEALKAASERGLLLINSSQCRAGAVAQGRYATSSELSRIGMISAGDMVLEAVITKSMYLMGKDLSNEKFKEVFQSDLRGELTIDVGDSARMT